MVNVTQEDGVVVVVGLVNLVRRRLMVMVMVP